MTGSSARQRELVIYEHAIKGSDQDSKRKICMVQEMDSRKKRTAHEASATVPALPAQCGASSSRGRVTGEEPCGDKTCCEGVTRRIQPRRVAECGKELMCKRPGTRREGDRSEFDGLMLTRVWAYTEQVCRLIWRCKTVGRVYSEAWGEPARKSNGHVPRCDA